MKLLCITKGPMYEAAVQGHWAIKFMETYEAVKEVEMIPYGKYYVLAEDPLYGYAEEHFVVLPDEDEIEEAVQQQEADHMDRVWKGIVRELDKMENA